MFTGIIEALGEVKHLQKEGSNLHIKMESPISHELKVDQSISHNGVCLTVTRIEESNHYVTAIDETIQKSTLGKLKLGDRVNLERCMVANGRFDGHIVQGHVDQIGVVKRIQEVSGSWLFDFQYDPSFGNVTVEKGSICIDGISLTCFNSVKDGFSVAIIPYTYQQTNFGFLQKGDSVNLEFDIVGKYIKRLINPH